MMDQVILAVPLVGGSYQHGRQQWSRHWVQGFFPCMVRGWIVVYC